MESEPITITLSINVNRRDSVLTMIVPGFDSCFVGLAALLKQLARLQDTIVNNWLRPISGKLLLLSKSLDLSKNKNILIKYTKLNNQH